MRGCFPVREVETQKPAAFPAYAGMFLRTTKLIAVFASFPRVCGDVSSSRRTAEILRTAFPAYAGMFPNIRVKQKLRLSFPRVCGDVSIAFARCVEAARLSPRMRGCFLNAVLVAEASVAFPAYAGMFPSQQTPKCLRVSFPRVCGDVSHICDSASLARQLSPRMRGCFYGRRITSFLERAFPAYAGMFLKRFTRKALLTSFPRVCGDVSRLASTNNKKKSLSPRMRGCFQASCRRSPSLRAFPAYAGMFPSASQKR